MKPTFWILTTLIVACVAVGGAAADGPGIELNETDLPSEPESYAVEIDDNTRVVDWSYHDDREGFEIVIESDRSQSISITEAVQFSEGAGTGRIYETRIPSGTSEVFVSVPRRGGEAAVTMTTQRSIQDNQFSYISTGEASPDRPPITYERAQLLVLITAIGAVGATFGIVKRRRDDEDRDYERIL